MSDGFADAAASMMKEDAAPPEKSTEEKILDRLEAIEKQLTGQNDKPKGRAAMSAKEKAHYIRDNGFEAFQNLPQD